MKLTQKQENYCLNLFKGMSQYAAYLEAGYSSKQSRATIDRHACALAKQDKILTRYEALRQKAEDESVGTVIERKQKLTKIYRAEVSDFLDEKQHIKQGEPLSAAIQKITTQEIKIGFGEYAQLVEITKLELLNPIQAIAEHNKMDHVYEAEGSMKVENRTLNIYVLSGQSRELLAEIEKGVKPHEASGDSDI